MTGLNSRLLRLEMNTRKPVVQIFHNSFIISGREREEIWSHALPGQTFKSLDAIIIALRKDDFSNYYVTRFILKSSNPKTFEIINALMRGAN